MAKIDCSVTVNFLREWRRMCDSFHDCSNCVLGMRDEFGFNRCKTSDKPEFTIEIVQKWSDEHPVKTRLGDIKERCPNVPLDGEGFPCFSPAMLGYCGDCNICQNWKNPDIRNCWHEPLDGGATGKAVE